MSITINDIAERAGVSLATVSRVMNNSGYVKEETRKKVMDIIEELNYVPNAIARSLSTSKSNSIGVIVPDINNPFFGEVIKGITDVADQNDLNIILFDADESIKKEIKSLKVLKEQRIQGVLIAPTSSEDDLNSEYIKTIESLNVPIVWIDSNVKYTNFSGVFVNSLKGTYDGIEAFIKEGHRDIAIITGRMNSWSAQERLLGYKKALAMNNLPLKNEYILYGNYKQESGYRLTKEILKMEKRPTAIFVCSNMMTLGCIKALKEENVKIPDEMAIIGFDNIDILNVVGMNISFVVGPSIELGRSSMKVLLDILDEKNNKDIKKITLSADLQLNGSEKYLR